MALVLGAACLKPFQIELLACSQENNVCVWPVTVWGAEFLGKLSKMERCSAPVDLKAFPQSLDVSQPLIPTQREIWGARGRFCWMSMCPSMCEVAAEFWGPRCREEKVAEKGRF